MKKFTFLFLMLMAAFAFTVNAANTQKYDISVDGSTKLSHTYVSAGEEIEVDLKVRNNLSPAEIYQTTYYLSNNENELGSLLLDVTDEFLGLGGYLGIYNPFPLTHNITIPIEYRTGGQYYVHILLNKDRKITEENYSNNLYTIPIHIIADPDISVDGSTSLNKTNFSPGDEITVDLKVRNNSTPSEVYPVSYYLSRNPYGTDIPISEELHEYYGFGGYLGINNPFPFRHYITLPSDLELGTYYLHVHLNKDGMLRELNYDNNQHNIKIIVSNKPDLTISDYILGNTNLTKGEYLTINTTVSNIGCVTAAASTLKYYLESTRSMSYIGSSRIGSIPKDGSITNSKSIKIPGYLSYGTYNVIVKADGSNEINEISEYNNEIRGKTINIISFKSAHSTSDNEIIPDVYPNPGNGVFKLNIENTTYTTLNVYNMQGSEIYSRDITGYLGIMEIDLSMFENGQYILYLTGLNKSDNILLLKK